MFIQMKFENRRNLLIAIDITEIFDTAFVGF